MGVLQAYLDGNLDDLSSRRVASHLKDCRRCSLEVSVYSEIKLVLREKYRRLDLDILEPLRRFGERLANGEETTLDEHGG